MKTHTMKKAAVAACVLLAVTLTTLQVSAQSTERVTEPVNATEFDVSPGRTYGVPGFAVDPGDPLHILAAAVDLRTQTCGTMETTDGGQSWASLDSSPSTDAFPLCLMTNSHTTQGKLAFGSDDRLYYALGGWDTPDGANRSIMVGRSDDMGESWQTTVVREARGLEDEEQQPNRPLSGFAVDTSGDEDVVYVTWRQQHRFTAPNQLPNLPMMAVSTDGGVTFSEPINLVGEHFAEPEARAEVIAATTTTAAPPETTTTTGDPATTTTTEAEKPATTTTTAPPGSPASDPDQQVNFGGTNPVVAVDDAGTAYAAWVSTVQNFDDDERPSPAHFLTRTSDRGATVEVFQISPFAPENVNGFGGIEMVWSPEGGSDGTLHVAYEASRTPNVSSERDVFYRQSTDRGETWSEAVVVNDDDPAQLYFSGIPNISVAPNGRLDVAWFDTRSDPGLNTNDVYYAYSTDNGASWSENIRVTDRPIDRRVGVFALQFDLNGPPGIASTDAFALVGWDDTRNFDDVTHGQDIYTAAVQFEELPAATSSTAQYLLAGVIGLVAVGLLFVLLAVLVRRRDMRRQALAAT